MIDRTPEQTEREHLLFEFIKAVGAFGNNAVQDERIESGVLWIHFTDFYENYDPELLEREGVLQFSTSLRYTPVGDWHDQFPPDAYHLTQKARLMWHHRATWVFKGEFTEEQRRAEQKNSPFKEAGVRQTSRVSTYHNSVRHSRR